MNIFNYSRRLPEIYGTFIALGLILYFFLIYLIGLIYVLELRLFNVVILVAGIYFALKQYKRTHAGPLNYFRALTIGLASSFIGISTFTLFLFLYLKVDTGLLHAIQQKAPLGPYLDAYIATFAVWIEGIFSGMIVTFLLTNFIDTEAATDIQ